MNHIYKTIWNTQIATFVAVSEIAKRGGKKSSSGTGGSRACFALKALVVSLMLSLGSTVYALPTGGVVSDGSASIASGAGSMTVTQTSQSAVINWQSFSIGSGEAVRFVQPNSSAVVLNRVLGSDPSSILGSLSSNGKVFLVNPNGILFGKGASINVGGLVASTLNITNADFMAGNYKFTGTGSGSVLNQGNINADGGYVALLGGNVSNEGVISAQLGTVALASGSAITLDMAGDGLLNVAVNQGAVNALVQNGGLIKADGGQVLMTTQAAGSLLSNAVNNTGVIQAQTIDTHSGKIMLMGGMENGTVNVGGTLDASAPNGGNGGFIETSAAHVNIANDAKVTTVAPMGLIGNWLIDPVDFTIAALGGNITGATLSAALVTNSITIHTTTGTNTATDLYGTTGTNGDIFVNDAVTWTAAPTPTTLTLLAVRDVNINAAITATNGNLVACCGRDVNVNAAITTVNGSVLLSAGRDANVNAAMSTTDGNITICAANNINVNGAITLTRGVDRIIDPIRSLGLATGLVLNAGNGGTGPGVGGGTVTFAPLSPLATVTGPNAPVTIYYNPVSYTAPTNYLTKFTLTLGATLTQYMLVFPDGGSKPFDGTTTATFTGLKGSPPGVSLVGPGTANFNTAAVGTNKVVTFSGYTLGGPNAGSYALPISCCAPVVQRTTANITAAAPPPPALPVVPLAILPPVAGLASMLTVVQADVPTSMLVVVAPAQPEPVPAIVPLETPRKYVAPVRRHKTVRN